MIFGSVCSGIEAASVAWAPLGWRAAFLSEIDAFPRAVLKHHHPSVPLHGDFTTIGAGQYDAIELLVGGTPCQSFSIAGLRGGLADGRGNLALEYLRLAQRLRPKWLVWENVPGVLSSNGGRDFGSILGGMGELGYGVAYRVLDAQYVRVDGLGRAVPQRRRRVFAVGYLGDWRRAAAVLFERESLQGNPAPRREAGEGLAPTLSARTKGGGGLGTDFDCDGGLVAATVAPTMRAGGNVTGGDRPYGTDVDTCDSLVAHSLRGGGFDASEDGTGRGTPLIAQAWDLRGREDGSQFEGPHQTANIRASSGGSSRSYVAFDETQITSAANRCNPQPGDPCHPLAKGARAPTIAFDARQSDVIQYGEKTGPLDTDGSTMAILSGWKVRRLTPRECERLQGFPEDYTAIPYRGKTAADGPRYKALGNSMAVNCMRWIGRRIEMVERVIISGQQ